MYLSVEDIKKHLNIDHSEDDGYLQDLIDAAERAVSNYLSDGQKDVTIHNFAPNSELLPDIKHAVRLLVGTWYASREATVFASAQELPFGLTMLLQPYKKFNLFQ